jgi:hypothetical protein
MGCWHGWHDGHGCASWHRIPYDRGWYEPVDYYDDADWPMRRRRPTARRGSGEAQELIEARLDALRDEVSRLEADLAEMRDTRARTEGR